MPATVRLIGREDELALVDEIIRAPMPSGAVIAGNAGVGKTRLAQEALALAARRGFSTAWASGTAGTRSIPFGALSHLLPPSLPATGGVGNPIRAAAEGLASVTGRGRFVLALDDAHHLDEHSAALVHHVTTAGTVLLLATLRTGEPVPDPIRALSKDGPCERIELQSLSEEEVAELLEATLGGQVDGATSHRISDLTEGNPLFVREVVSLGIASGRLRETGGLWRWRGDLPASSRLFELLGERLADLSDEERSAVEVIALGEPLEARLVEDLIGRDRLGKLERDGLVTERTDGHRALVHLVHPLYGEAVRSETPPARRRSALEIIGDALERTGARRRGDLLRLATLRLESGRTERAETLLLAAQQAVALADYVLAERLARAGAEGGSAQGKVILAQALIGQGRFSEGEEILARVAQEVSGERERAEVAAARANNLAWNMADAPAALEIIAQVLGAISDEAARQELSALRAYLLVLADRLEEAIAEAAALLETPNLSDSAVVQLMGGAGQGATYAGRPVYAMRLFERFREQFDRGVRGLPYAPIAETAYRFGVGMFSGTFGETAALTERAYRDALETQADWVRGFLAGTAGAAVLAEGRVRTAIRWLQEAVTLAEKEDVARQAANFYTQLAQGYAYAGNPEAAEEALARADPRGVTYIEPWLIPARVWTTVVTSSTSLAIEEALRGSARLAERGYRSGQAMVLHAVVRLGRSDLVVDELTAVAERSDSPLFGLFAEHARALLASDGVELDRITTEFERLPAYLLAAEASAQAAAAHAKHGDTRSAAAAARRAAELAERCEGARTPALLELQAPVPLTAREREIATLAARGLSNREIAKRLVVSVRTVDNHLHRAYAKLGVSGRDELAAQLQVGERG